MTTIDITPVTGLFGGPLLLIHINGCPHAIPAVGIPDLARDLLAMAESILTGDESEVDE
jgi:hypothetical protein